MITKKSEDAVSPVIGIMLLVVVTVVIAAVITTFATGVVGSTEPAPVATLDVEILSNVNTLEEHGTKGLAGPDLWITHLSGEAVDTADIELQFSWTHKDGEGKDCYHHSTYSADGFKEEHPQGIAGPDGAGGLRAQALYVKSLMPHQKENPEYGSKNMPNDHFFGDVILTPGLKLTANTDFLILGGENTNSPFMDVIFDNYHVSTKKETTTIGYDYRGYTKGVHKNGVEGYDIDCQGCIAEYGKDVSNIGGVGCWDEYSDESTPDNVCVWCYNEMSEEHPLSECSAEKECSCVIEITQTKVAKGIMEHLLPGTAVDVMIIHTPSGKAIYDKTVIVE